VRLLGRFGVNTDCCVVEIVNSEGASLPLGAEGRIVVTNLFNLTMPFIRYDLGDYGTLTSPGGDLCDCGSRHPAMLPPAGRSDDFFRLANGSVLAPRTVEAHVVPPLDLLTKQFPNIIGSPTYQIIQESEQLLRVRIASHFGFQERLRLRIESSFRAAGYDVSVIIEPVAAIPRTPSGNRVVSSRSSHTRTGRKSGPRSPSSERWAAIIEQPSRARVEHRRMRASVSAVCEIGAQEGSR